MVQLFAKHTYVHVCMCLIDSVNVYVHVCVCLIDSVTVCAREQLSMKGVCVCGTPITIWVLCVCVFKVICFDFPLKTKVLKEWFSRNINSCLKDVFQQNHRTCIL